MFLYLFCIFVSFFLYFFVCAVFLFKLKIIFIQNCFYLIDEESSGLATCTMWLESVGVFPQAEKIQTQVTHGVEDIDLLDILKKEHVETPGVFMKNSFKFHWSCFLILEFPQTRGVTQLCRVAGVEVCFLRVKWQI